MMKNKKTKDIEKELEIIQLILLNHSNATCPPKFTYCQK